MMSEKRFSWKTEKLQHSNDEVLLVVDNENKEWKGHILNIIDLLNEQQEKIEHLEDVCKLLNENEGLKQQLVDVTKSIDSLCNRVDKSNRSNEFKWGAIMGLRTLQRELEGDGV